MGIVKAVCLSEKKGTVKRNVKRAYCREQHGLEGDAHAGNWHRQISILPQEAIDAFRLLKPDVQYGDFGENLVVTGYDLKSMPIGSVFRCGESLLRLTQIGKECHQGCQIQKLTGSCIMPREGVFFEVLKGGFIQEQDEFTQVE